MAPLHFLVHFRKSIYLNCESNCDLKLYVQRIWGNVDICTVLVNTVLQYTRYKARIELQCITLIEYYVTGSNMSPRAPAFSLLYSSDVIHFWSANLIIPVSDPVLFGNTYSGRAWDAQKSLNPSRDVRLKEHYAKFHQNYSRLDL